MPNNADSQRTYELADDFLSRLDDADWQQLIIDQAPNRSTAALARVVDMLGPIITDRHITDYAASVAASAEEAQVCADEVNELMGLLGMDKSEVSVDDLGIGASIGGIYKRDQDGRARDIKTGRFISEGKRLSESLPPDFVNRKCRHRRSDGWPACIVPHVECNCSEEANNDNG